MDKKSSGNHKQLMLLGMLLQQPMYGYQLKELIDTHLDFYSDLKKPNLYYLLERLAADGYLTAQQVAVAEAAGEERLVYQISEAGRDYFYALLRGVLSAPEPIHNSVDVAIFFLDYLTPAEALAALRQRRRALEAHLAATEQQMGKIKQPTTHHDIVNDHILTLYRAELGWLERTINRLEGNVEQ